MISIVKRSGLVISKKHENDEFFKRVKEHLERKSLSYDRSYYVFNNFYVDGGKFLLIPRNFPIQQYLFDYKIIDKRHEGQPINIDHNIIPRSESQQKAIDYLMNNEDGILQLAPGVGKTVIAIYMVAERKKKTLILLHREQLAEQWKNRFLQFTTLPETDVARLRSSSFEEDLKSPIIIATTQTFLSILKRKRKEFLVALDEANIGVFIADEVHTSVGAPTFSECSIHMPSKYNYGLSATPYRHDGNEDIIKFHLGEVFLDEDITGTMKAKATVFLLDYQVDTPRRHRYIHWEGRFQRSRYLNLLRKSKPFLELTKSLLTKLRDRELICMVERVKIIDDLYTWLPNKDKSRFYQSEGLETLKSKTTFATPGKCRDGIDAPWKDCIIMTSPISNIEQLTGRINRISENKKTPIIIDMVDRGSKDISRTFFNRLKFYEKKEWPIQFILVKEKRMKQIDRETTLEILNEN
ncbi:MAG: DEAD/DEAH box helicase [Candidatus Heimdallarchaeaceae archaeon]